MVVINCYLGLGDVQIESELLKKLASVSAQCERIGLPLCGEIIPRVSYADKARTMPTSADLAIAIRMGLDTAATWSKQFTTATRPATPRLSRRATCRSSWRAGQKEGELAIFQQLHEAMTHGASGAAIGRRVWGTLFRNGLAQSHPRHCHGRRVRQRGHRAL